MTEIFFLVLKTPMMLISQRGWGGGGGGGEGGGGEYSGFQVTEMIVLG